MRITRLSLPILAMLSACAIDNQVVGDEKDQNDFDEGTEPTLPGTDTTNTGTTGTTTTTIPPVCQDRHYNAEEIPRVESCPGGPTSPDWEFETLWEVRLPPGSNTPAVVGQLTDDDGDGDADADDTPDIVIMDVGTTLRAINGEDGSALWSTMLGSAMGTIPAIGDMDGDGFPEVIMDAGYSTTAFNGEDGRVLWVGPYYSAKDKGSCGAHGIGDLDGDGIPEVYLGGTIIDGSNGDLLGSGDYGDGLKVGNSLGMSVAADLDMDGNREVVVGNAAYDIDGNAVWNNGDEDGTVAIADLDMDGSPELIRTNDGDGLVIMDAEGNELWMDGLDGAKPSAAAVADVDGDGDPDIIVPTMNRLYVFEGDGSVLWDVADSTTSTDRGGASAYDLDGNGAWEVIWSGPSGVQIFDGVTGETLVESSGKPPSCAGPVPVVDLDGDFRAEIVVLDSTSGALTALSDTSGFTTARTVWNQSDYNFTNVEDDGSIPMDPTPSWEMYNNFRAGPPIEKMQNLFPQIRDVCNDECAAG